MNRLLLLFIIFSTFLIPGLVQGQSITFTNPTSASSVSDGSSLSLSWNAEGVADDAYLRFEYSLDNGANWYYLTANVSSNLNGNNTWSIPSGFNSTEAKVRITVNNVQYGESDAFTITSANPSSLVVSAPSDGEVLTAGESYAISFIGTNLTHLSNNRIGIYYSLDGVTFYRITYQLFTSTTSYNWTVPNLNETNVIIRVTHNEYWGSHTNSPFFTDKLIDISSATPPTIAITSPTTGDNLTDDNSPYNITFTSANLPGDASMKLEATINNGDNWAHLATNPSSPYSWSIPAGVNSDNVKLRYSATNYPLITTTGVFSISTTTPKSFTLTYPNGGESFTPGDEVTISWTRENITDDYAEVHISYDGGATYQMINEVFEEGQLTFPWTVPDVQTTEARIKVYQPDWSYGTSVEDESDANFTILEAEPLINITSPDESTSLLAGNNLYIGYTAYGIDAVNIDYSLDGGENWSSIVNDHAISGGTINYYWSTPSNLESTNAKVRVLDAGTSGVGDTSQVFVINQPYVNVLTPAESTALTPGANYNITWEASTNTGNMEKLEYSTDGGNNWTQIASGNYWVYNGTYSWSVPNINSNAQIRITRGTTEGLSGSFTIGTITTPVITASTSSVQFGVVDAGGANTGASFTVSGSDLENDIYIEATGAFDISLDSVTFSNAVTIPMGDATDKKVYVLFIAATNDGLTYNGSLKHYSENADTVWVTTEGSTMTPDTLAITYPVGGETWIFGTEDTIAWSTNIASGSLEYYYSVNDGSWILWNDEDVTTRKATVTVPADWAEGSNYRIKIVASEQSDSSGYFTVQGPEDYITLTSPTGGENWKAGTAENVTWDTNIENGQVEVYHSIDDGAWSWLTDANITAGEIAVNVPAEWAAGSNYRVKIVANSLESDFSDYFTVQEKDHLTLTYPTGGEAWTIEESDSITWSTNLASGSIEFYYSINGEQWQSFGNSTVTDESYFFTVPAELVPSTDYRVKITSGIHADSSATTFEVAPVPPTNSVVLTSPNGSETWAANSWNTITWNATSGVNYVSIEHSLDGTNWTTIASRLEVSLGSFNWYIQPTTTPGNHVVRIKEWNANRGITDTSDDEFYITAPDPIVSVSSVTDNEMIFSKADSITGGLHDYMLFGNYLTDSIKIYTENAFFKLSYDQVEWSDTLYYKEEWENTSKKIYVRYLPVDHDGITHYSQLHHITTGADTLSVNLEGTSKESLIMIYPMEGDEVVAGDTVQIKFEFKGIDKFTAVYHERAGGEYLRENITQTTLNRGIDSVRWIVPVIVSDAHVIDFLYGFKSDTFKIVSPEGIHISDINAATQWTVGTDQPVRWITGEVDNTAILTVELSIDGGTTFQVLTEGTLAELNGRYEYWIERTMATTEAVIKVSSTDGQYVGTSETFVINDVDFFWEKVVTFDHRKDFLYSSPDNQVIAASSTTTARLTDYSPDGGASWKTILNKNINNAAIIENQLFVNTLLKRPNVNAWDNDSIMTTTDPAAGWTGMRTIANSSLKADQAGNLYIIDGSDETLMRSTDRGTSFEAIIDHVNNFNISATGDTIVIYSEGKYLYSHDTGISFKDIDAFVPNNRNINFHPNGDIYIENYRSTNGGESFVKIPGDEFLVSIKNVDPKGNFYSNYFSNWHFSQDGTNFDRLNGNLVNGMNQVIFSDDTAYALVFDIIANQTTIYSWPLPDNNLNEKIVVDQGLLNFGAVAANDPQIKQLMLSGIDLSDSITLSCSRYFELSTDSILFTRQLKIDGNVTDLPVYVRYISTENNNWSINETLTLTSPGVANLEVSLQAKNAAPYLSLISPNGGETLYVGDRDTIRWDTDSGQPLKISYSINDGGWKELFTVRNPSIGYAAFTVPTNWTPASTYKIKVETVHVSDESDNYFTVNDVPADATLVLESPNGGEVWNIGKKESVTWSTNLTRGYVDFYYSLSDGAWVKFHSHYPAADGVTYFQVPESFTRSEEYKIKMESSGLADSSAAFFTIVDPVLDADSLKLGSPAGGDFYALGAPINVSWFSSLSTGRVEVSYSINDGAWTYLSDAPVAAGAVNVVFDESFTPSEQYRIKIEALGLSDSSAYFTMHEPLVTLTGMAFEDNNVGAAGQAVLYTTTLEVHDEVDLVNGTFTFEQVAPGDYFVKVEPDNNNYLTTYLGNTIYWEQTEIFTVTRSDLSGLEIILQKFTAPAEGLFEGNANITGRLSKGTGTGGRVQYGNRDLENETPIANTYVYLLNPADFSIIMAVQTNVDGEYSITGIAAGTYLLLIDVPGAEPYSFTIENENGQVELNASVLEDGSFVYDFSETVITSTEGELVAKVTIHPMPASLWLNISADKIIDWVRILNMKGGIELHEKIDANTTRLNLSEIRPGVFVLMYQKQGKVFTERITIIK